MGGEGYKKQKEVTPGQSKVYVCVCVCVCVCACAYACACV